ncbi:MAG: hypothetical protein V4648_03585 [Bacteroidota bacterium]
MRNLIIYLALSLCFFATKLSAQETFVSRVQAIADKIDNIKKEEKATLKAEVEEVNVQLEKGSITKEQADTKKKALADARATIIENKVNAAKEELKDLVQERVDGKLKDSNKKYSISFPGGYSKNDSLSKYKGESRTTTQFVFAAGFNNLVTDGAVAHSDYRYLKSTFYEWGLTHNTRILKDNNLLHFKYGVSFMYNHLNATDERYFVVNGDQTELATFPTHLRTKDTYFKNVYVTIPLHLEFDFTKDGKDKEGNKIFRSHRGFRFGLGGFVGHNINSKQFLSYEVDGYRINERQKGSWNVNDWNYGASAYVGWGEASLYLKYDINPLFKNNAVDQNNISLGMRFDFN